MANDLLKRIKKIEKEVRRNDFPPVVFIKPGESPGIIGPRTVVFIDNIPEDDE
jgi:hypothetical protein